MTLAPVTLVGVRAGPARGAQAVSPTADLTLTLRSEVPVASAQLVAEVRFEPRVRTWTEAEREALRELFGPDALWERSTGPRLWTQQTLLVPAFEQDVDLTLSLPVDPELGAATGKFLFAARSGELPVAVLLRGTVFLREADALRACPMPPESERAFGVSVELLRDALDRALQGRRLLTIRPEHHAQLQRLQRELGAVDLDATLGRLLARASEEVDR